MVSLNRLNQGRPIGQRGFTAIGIIDKAMEKLKPRRDLPGRQIRMRAQPKTRVGRGISFGIACKLNISLHIPQHAKITVTHRANALSEFE